MSNSFASKHSTTAKLFEFETPDHFEFIDLAGLVELNGMDKVYPVKAIYINKKGKYGEQPTIITDNAKVNAPHHLTRVCKEVLQDGESIGLINRGYVGFKIYSYENEYGVNYSLEWVDVDPKDAPF